MIVITKSFKKDLSHFSVNVSDELASLISKHTRGLAKNFILLKREGDLLVYKWYLDGKRVRITVLKTEKGNYIPLEILKKESKDGYNIRADYDASTVIDLVNREIEKGEYEVWEV